MERLLGGAMRGNHVEGPRVEATGRDHMERPQGGTEGRDHVEGSWGGTTGRDHSILPGREGLK